MGLFNDHVLDVCHDHLADAKATASGNNLLMARNARAENAFNHTQDVVNYLKAIKAAISNRPFWDIVDWRCIDLSTAEAMADEIMNIRRHEKPLYICLVPSNGIGTISTTKRTRR